MRKPTEDCHGFKKNQISPSTALLQKLKTMIIKTKMVTKNIKKKIMDWVILIMGRLG